jgi:hypothetical protein
MGQKWNFSPLRALIASAALLACGACDIAYIYEGKLDGLDGGRKPGDSSDPEDSSGQTIRDDAGTADRTEVLPSFRPVTIATSTATAFPSGNAQQSRVVFAAGEWWVFVISGTKSDKLDVLHSKDFTEFQSAGSMALPFPVTDGRNIAVSARKLGATDVVHVAISVRVTTSDRRHYHARGTLVGGTATFSAPALIGSIDGSEAALDPDGPATLILQSGQVLQASGFSYFDGTTGRGNAQIFRSGVDDGATFDSTFVQAKVEYTTGYINARQLLQTQDQTGYFFYESASADPSPDNVTAAISAGGTGAWTKTPVFAKSAQGANDWSAAVRGANDVDVVRRTSDLQTFEHRRLASGAFVAGAAMTKDAGKAGTGVVLLGLGDTLGAFAIGSDDANSIRNATYQGGTWSAWTSLSTTAAVRTALSGYVSTADKRAALVWTESSGSELKIVGTEVPYP